MDDRYQLPSATSLSLPAKISPEIRATIFYPVSTDASFRRSKPVLFAIRSSFSPVSASQTIGEKFPNLRVRGRILCSKNIISPDVYGPLFLHSSFYLRISIDLSLFTPSRNETRRYQHDLGIEWSVSFRFGFRAVLVNFIFVDRYEIGDRSDQSQRDREKSGRS